MNRSAAAEPTAAAAAWLAAQRPLANRWVTATIGLSMANGLLLIAQAWLLARTLDAVVFADAGLTEVGAWLWWILALFCARALLLWGSDLAAFRAAALVKLAVRDRLYRHLLSLGPARLALERSGELSTVLTDGVEALEAYYARYLPAAALMALLPFAILAVVFPLDWLSGLVLLLTAPLIPLFMILIGQGAERLNQRQWRRLTRLSAHFLDVIQGLTTLKLFNASRRETETIARISDAYRESTMAVLRVAFLSSLALEFFATVSIALVAVSIGFRLLWGEMDFLPGLLILLLAPEFYLPLRNMGTHYHARMDAVGAAERIVHLLALAAPAPPVPARPVPDMRLTPIRFVDTAVTFPGGQRGLDGIDLEIRPGEHIAIVGPSGAGKSTLANLLLGFVAPSRGDVLIGDHPLAALDIEAWRRQLGWVPQRPHLFAASVAENIRLARPGASDAAVVAAARQAQVHDVIAQLPQGYQTPIGEGGIALSGGQAQRIALARACLRRAPLLLLDEPTASLDAHSEGLVQTALADLARGATLVVIAHRLDTVRKADRILLLEDGRLGAQGPHPALLATSATYRRLVDDFGDAA